MDCITSYFWSFKQWNILKVLCSLSSVAVKGTFLFRSPVQKGKSVQNWLKDAQTSAIWVEYVISHMWDISDSPHHPKQPINCLPHVFCLWRQVMFTPSTVSAPLSENDMLFKSVRKVKAMCSIMLRHIGLIIESLRSERRTDLIDQCKKLWCLQYWHMCLLIGFCIESMNQYVAAVKSYGWWYVHLRCIWGYSVMCPLSESPLTPGRQWGHGCPGGWGWDIIHRK